MVPVNQIRKKIESVEFWEFDERRRENLLNDAHDWCLVIPPPPLDACIAITLTSIKHSLQKFFP